MKSRTHISHAPDYGLLICVLALVFLGSIFVYSSSYVFADLEYGDSLHFIKRQLIFCVIGIVGMLLIMKLDYQHLKDWSPFFMLLVLVALVAILVPNFGVESNGVL